MLVRVRKRWRCGNRGINVGSHVVAVPVVALLEIVRVVVVEVAVTVTPIDLQSKQPTQSHNSIVMGP